MPTYDYQCDTCGVCFELVQSFSEDTLKKCPTRKSGNSPDGCTSVGRGKVRKVFSAPSIAFKGSGFYKNDSRSGSSSDKSTSDKSGTDKKSSDKKSSDTSSTVSAKSDKSSSDSGSSNTKSSTSKTSSSSSSD